MNPRTAINVSSLPSIALDHRSPLWWGNLWLLVIESVVFAIMLASYFYIRLNYSAWPPPQVNRLPFIYDTNPALGISTANLIVILVIATVSRWADRACFRLDQKVVNISLGLMMLLGAVTIALRFVEFRSTHFRWDDNAYASVVWTILGLHLMHLLIAALEALVLATWTFRKKLDDKHARDVRLLAIYWYWIAGVWVILYGVVYFGPRLL
jgi:cytochrome c oxidase subunit III